MLTELNGQYDVDLTKIVAIQPNGAGPCMFWLEGCEEHWLSEMPYADLLKLVNEAQGEHGDVRLQLEGLRTRVDSQDAMIQVLLDTQTNACTAMKSLKELAAQNQGRIEALEETAQFDLKSLGLVKDAARATADVVKKLKSAQDTILSRIDNLEEAQDYPQTKKEAP